MALLGSIQDFSVDESEWSYLSEGKKHLVVTNNRSLAFPNVRGEAFFKMVLRIPKILTQPHSRDADNISSYTNDISFITNVMAQWFHSSFIPPILGKVMITPSVLHRMNAKMLPCRPEKRRKQSHHYLAEFGFLEPNLNYVTKDMPEPPSPGAPHRYQPSSSYLAVEIKVKCGLKSRSPFTKLSRRAIKLNFHKYHIMQLYKKAKVSVNNGQHPAWGEFSTISQYNPRELCSQTFDQVKKSVDILLGNPQNNLRVSVDSQHIYGWNKGDCDDLRKACESLFSIERLVDTADIPADDVAQEPHSNTYSNICSKSCSRKFSGKDAFATELSDVISSILTVEDVCHRLELMQRVDLIGEEGAAVVFSRLSELLPSTPSSNKTGLDPRNQLQIASDFLLHEMVAPIDDTFHVVLRSLLKYLEEEESKSFSASASDGLQVRYGLYDKQHITNDSAESLEEVPPYIAELIALRIDKRMSDKKQHVNSCRAFELVARLKLQDCVTLLRLWTMALVAKDAGVLVSLNALIPVRMFPDKEVTGRGDEDEEIKKRSGEEQREEKRQSRERERGTPCRVVKQTDSIAGLVICPTSQYMSGRDSNSPSSMSASPNTSLAYSISLVDIGLKPVEKIWERYFEDEIVCATCSAYLSQGKLG